VGNNENRNRDEFPSDHVQILGTDPDNPEEGRIFVWTKIGWFERAIGQMGNVAFIHVAKSELELNALISRDDPSLELVLLGRKYQKIVSEEFMEQSPEG
jgi:hypothetical protein